MEYPCTECMSNFFNHHDLRAHVKKMHPDKLDVIAPSKTFKCVEVCKKCLKSFSKYCNYKRHVAKFHPEILGELSASRTYPYKCSECNKNFSLFRNLKSHQKTHLNDNDNKKNERPQKCSLCDYTNAFKSNLIVHYEDFHKILMERQDFYFSSEVEFQKWKTNWEKDNYSSYVTYSRPFTTTEGIKKTTYVCHRSGFYVKKGQDMRQLKSQGSKKINGICPSQMTVSLLLEIGSVKVDFIKTHVGHENELIHLNIPDNEKMEIASKIASNIPLTSILDEIRGSATSDKFERIHLLTRKDLHNISQSFNLRPKGIQHQNEDMNIVLWIHEVQDSGIILFYKLEGVLCDDHPCLRKKDFLLIIMHPEQMEVLDNYSENVICIDRIQGCNAYDFELTTMLILDDENEGFPCCFMIGNRSDEQVMTIFLMKIKEKLGRGIQPRVFMSDMPEFYYSAWLQIMSPAEFRLFCSWHIDRSWRKNLNLCDNEEQQVIVYKQLHTLLQLTDTAAFIEMLQNFHITLLSSADTQKFGEYFEKYFLSNLESWAYCYRLQAGINTNMSMEQMHHTIEYLYFNGKQVRHLVETVNSLMKLIKDKLFEQLVPLNEGKVTSKIRELRKRHKASLGLDIGSVVQSERGWEVPSSATNRVDLVQENKLNCDCTLVCSICETCLHAYSCTCLDNNIGWNMCKHIHLVCQFMKCDGIHDTEDRFEDETRITLSTEQEELVEDLNKSDLNPDRMAIKLEIEKQKLIQLHTQMIRNISTLEELETFKNVTASLEPTLTAVAENSGNSEQECVRESSYRTKNNEKILVKNCIILRKPNREQEQAKLSRLSTTAPELV